MADDRREAIRERLRRKVGPRKDGSKEPRSWKAIFLLLIVAGGALPVLFSIVSFTTTYFFPKSVFFTLSAEDPGMLKRVFFSGDPWLVICSKDPNLPGVDSILLDAAVDGANQNNPSLAFQSGVLDCGALLPSGVSTYQRFNIPAPKRKKGRSKRRQRDFQVFTVANGYKPRVLPESLYVYKNSNSAYLSNYLSQQFFPGIVAVKTPKQWMHNCMRRPQCLVYLHDGAELDDQEKRDLYGVSLANRLVSVVHLDASQFWIDLQKKFKPVTRRNPISVYFRKPERGTTMNNKKVLIEGKSRSGPVDMYSLQAFIDSCANSNALKQLVKYPIFSERPDDQDDIDSGDVEDEGDVHEDMDVDMDALIDAALEGYLDDEDEEYDDEVEEVDHVDEVDEDSHEEEEEAEDVHTEEEDMDGDQDIGHHEARSIEEEEELDEDALLVEEEHVDSEHNQPYIEL